MRHTLFYAQRCNAQSQGRNAQGQGQPITVKVKRENGCENTEEGAKSCFEVRKIKWSCLLSCLMVNLTVNHCSGEGVSNELMNNKPKLYGRRTRFMRFFKFSVLVKREDTSLLCMINNYV